MVPMVYAAILLVTLIIFWFGSASNPRHLAPSNVKFTDRLKRLMDPKVLR